MPQMRLLRIIYVRLIIGVVLTTLIATAFGQSVLPRLVTLFSGAALVSSLLSFTAVILYFHRTSKDEETNNMSEQHYALLKRFSRRMWWVMAALTPLMFAFLLTKE